MSQIEANDGKIEVIIVQKLLFGKSPDGLKVCAILALVTQSNHVSTSQGWKHLRLACEAFFLGSIRVDRRDVIRLECGAALTRRDENERNPILVAIASFVGIFCTNGRWYEPNIEPTKVSQLPPSGHTALPLAGD
jgi:hypothetical protein